MHGTDCIAHLRRVIDQRVALRRDRIEQPSDANFVFRIGALERGNFAVDQALELGGARQRAFDAIAHGGDLATDRLADVHDRIARQRFRLGEPDCDFGHRLTDKAQLLRAREHVGEHEHERDRPQEDGQEAEHERDRHHYALAEQTGDGGAEGSECEPARDREPDNGEHPRVDVGARGRALLQGAQKLADALAVVVGGLANAFIHAGRGVGGVEERFVDARHARGTLRAAAIGGGRLAWGRHAHRCDRRWDGR
ncbi:MAG: hypothetical protein WBL84_00860, partial [Xanthobacteraceae bacterium]